MRKYICIFLGLFLFNSIQAQTLEELKATKAEKETIKKGIDKEIVDLDKKIKEFSGWTKGLSGLVGLDFAGANNWFANDIETATSSGFGLTINGYVNGNMEKYFVRNSLLATLNTSKATNTDLNGDTGVEAPKQEITAKASYFELSNLTGFYFAKNIAVSAKGSYTTTIFEFNDPGQLSISAGLTWTPSKSFVAYVHPLAYQWTFPSGDFAAAAGAEIGASYTGTLFPGVDWASNLNAFLAYGGKEVNGTERSAGDLSNWTWMNAFTVADVFKGIGLGVNIGLRNNKQLGFAKNVGDGGGLQVIYSVGLSYALTR